VSDPGSKDRPTPHPLDTPQEARQLDRYYVIGLVCMLALIVAFPVYKLGEPDRRQKTDQAMREQNVALGADLFAQHCMSCHGVAARGGRGFPTLGAKEFLTSVSDRQLQWLIAGGLPGSVMTAYDMDLGGPFTMQEIARLVAYLRSMEDGAPSVKGWHQGELAPAQMRRVRTESDGSHDDDDDDKHRSDDKDERETGSIAQAESGPVGANRELQQLFTSRCATCHGAVGEGTPIAGRIRPLSPALAANPDSASDIISRGVAGTAMTAFAKTHGGQLDETRIRALVEWLRQTP
jgi:mono/diheme cytochrome c family protein